jgi:iron complex transport system ATP-binding protein
MSLLAERLGWAQKGKQILTDVSGELTPGTLLAIIGPNGAGKSSLLHLLAGGERPDSGTVSLDGQLLSSYSAASLARRRAVLTQEQSLLFPFTVRDVVAMGSLLAVNDEDIEHCLRYFSAAELIDRPYLSLSGGERQRVQIARVLLQLLPSLKAGDPAYLFLDEPLNALDLNHQFALMALLESLRDRGFAIACVIHDLVLARRFADQVWVLSNGRLVAQGGAAKVINECLLDEVFMLPEQPRKVMASLLDCAGA